MSQHSMSYDQFCSMFPISRETYEKFDVYVSLVGKWQNSINLVSNATLPCVWERHIVDSYQLVDSLSSSSAVVDIGSGAGFPGLVLAIAGGAPMTLVESDGRKVAFLREAARVLEVPVTILHQRVEKIVLPGEATVTARAFASIADILLLLKNTLTPRHSLLLLKGRSYEGELAKAAEFASFDVRILPSKTDASGALISIANVVYQQGGL